jgi:3-keto-5-aminohexanoate cleavage enzyme
MITASCGFVRPPGQEPRPDTVAEVVESVHQCYLAGACIAQVRAPLTIDPQTGRASYRLEDWIAIAEGVRGRCDILLMVGVAGGPVEQRAALLDAVQPDIASFLLTHHDIVVRGHDIYQLRTRADAVRMLRAHLERGVVPDFEFFHPGMLWNLQQCLAEVAVPRPLAVTLFFWDGGTWAPPTVEELLQRVSALPQDVSWTLATAHGPEHTLMHAVAIGRGGHVRAGLGDHYPYYREGVMAGSNAQLVSRLARLGEELNREVATPAMAAQMLGLRRRTVTGRPGGTGPT